MIEEKFTCFVIGEIDNGNCGICFFWPVLVKCLLDWWAKKAITKMFRRKLIEFGRLSRNYFIKAWTTAFALSAFRSVYVWPVPTNTIGCPVMYVMEMAAPTLSSIVSNLVSTMPSIRCGFGELEWSAKAWLNLTSWSTASLPTRASPTNNTKSGSFTCWRGRKQMKKNVKIGKNSEKPENA